MPKICRAYTMKCPPSWELPPYNGARYHHITVHVFKEVMGSEVFSRVLRDMLSLYSNKVLKLLAKEHCKQPQKSVKMYSKEKMSDNL
jgi:hypothetical protein